MMKEPLLLIYPGPASASYSAGACCPTRAALSRRRTFSPGTHARAFSPCLQAPVTPARPFSRCLPFGLLLGRRRLTPAIALRSTARRRCGTPNRLRAGAHFAASQRHCCGWLDKVSGVTAQSSHTPFYKGGSPVKYPPPRTIFKQSFKSLPPPVLKIAFKNDFC
jgi:hypothetical protein